MFEKHPEVRKKWKLRKIFSTLIWAFELSSSAIHIRIARRILHLPLELMQISKKILKIKISLFQKWSAIEVWDYSFPEAKDQWGCFLLMTYLEENSCYTIVMNRFREIASVRLPGNRFRRRHMSPEGIRPSITLSIDPRSSALRAITLWAWRKLYELL